MLICRSEGKIGAELIVQEIKDKGEEFVQKVVNATNEINETPLYVAVNYSDNKDLVMLLIARYLYC